MKEPTLTYSAESAASPSPHNGQDTEQLLFANEINSAKPSSRNTARRSRVIKIFASSADGKYRGVALLTGGFPCQPFSCARKRQVRWMLGENVIGIDGLFEIIKAITE